MLAARTYFLLVFYAMTIASDAGPTSGALARTPAHPA